MLHRISSLTIDSPSPKGNPRLAISFTAEGMSADGAEDQLELLARTSLMTAVKEMDTSITATPSEFFPSGEPLEEFEPFLVRIDRELMRVEAVTTTGWQVARGAEGTQAASHEADAIIELFPVAWDRREKTQEQYAAFVKASPFVIPSAPKTYTPRITGVSEKSIKPGEAVKFTAKADGLDPELGTPQFALSDAAVGMTIDAASGEFLWMPLPQLAPGDYTATILMTLGRQFTATAAALDDDATDTLKFSLGSGSPEGLTVDQKTGQLKWTPPTTFTPGKYAVEVKVTDSSAESVSASATIALDVQDDFAALTLLSGIVGKDGVLHAWFRNKATGKMNPLKAGENLHSSDISAEIVAITDRYVTMKDVEGLWKLKLGEGLRQRQLIEPSPKPTTQPTPAVEPPAVEPPAVEPPAVEPPAPGVP